MVATTTTEALNALVKSAGSQSELARRLGVSQTAVWKWLHTSKRLPAEYVLTAESLYGISRHDLRPDIYPPNYPPAPVSGGKTRSAHRLNDDAPARQNAGAS